MIEPRNRRGEAETCRWSLCGSSDGDEWVELHKGTWCLAQDALCVSPVSGVCSPPHRCLRRAARPLPPPRTLNARPAYASRAAAPPAAHRRLHHHPSMQVLPVQNRRRQVGRRQASPGAIARTRPTFAHPHALCRWERLLFTRLEFYGTLFCSEALPFKRSLRRRVRDTRSAADGSSGGGGGGGASAPGGARGGPVRGGGAGCPRPRRGDCVRAWAAAAGRGARRDERDLRGERAPLNP